MARRYTLPKVADTGYSSPESWHRFGTLTFFAGVLLAILAAFIPGLQARATSQVLAILGIAVGVINVTSAETTEFLVASITLLLVGAAGAIPDLGEAVLRILANIVAFVAPAALVVALKAIWALAEHR
jgi:hypothetical protein